MTFCDAFYLKCRILSLSLEERYEFTYNVTGYEKEVIDDDGIRFSVKYSDAKIKSVFHIHSP